MSTEHTTCVVAGGGPAGMVLGLLLARAGVDVTVLEKHGDFLRDFRGDTVHPTTLRLLDDLGLGDRFQHLPHSKVDRIEFPAPGGPVVAADLRRLPGRYQYVAMVPQWDLLDMLAEAGAEEPCFHLRMNTEATGTIVDKGAVVGVHYRTSDGTTGELRADLTVAADGRWSTLRTAAGLHPHEFPVPMDTWWFRLPRRATDSDAGLTAQINGCDIGLTINRTDYYQIALLARKGTDAQLRADGLDRFRARIAALLPALADRVDTITSLDDVKYLDVRLNRLRTWYRKGLLCIGDAAHAMSPAGGVGINLAIQDAVATATLLARPLLTHHLTPADLARVQRRRWLPTVVTQRVQQMLHAAMFAPVVNGQRTAMPPVLVELLRRVRVLRYIPAYIIGVGVRPERAPQFARRQTVPMLRPTND
ncbi:MAG TPA: FAD-dependent oxidoreductase [Pseudonocardiaceae bacterium]|jgi:2-polyprenyl-6-methoxyphenol hydroxylase-like FAD-dependent oxidoreductase|nr:FAD-dependent oxidoreductase [Pseudonocardiaceae bacterium]